VFLGSALYTNYGDHPARFLAIAAERVKLGRMADRAEVGRVDCPRIDTNLRQLTAVRLRQIDVGPKGRLAELDCDLRANFKATLADSRTDRGM
jgi:hypothetical protein